MRRSVHLLALCTLVVIGAVQACGGGGGGASSSPRPVPTPAPSSNPCLNASIEAPENEGPLVNETDAAAVKRRGRGLDGDPRGRVFTNLWQHAASAATRSLFMPPARAATEDVGEIAVIQDSGDLLTQPNPFDLKGLGLRFTRTGSSYDVSRIDGSFRSNLGTRIRLQDDDSMSFTLPFSFPLYGKGQPRAFVNSDGNITFEEEDRASSERDVSRLMTGPPRVAPFFADLDPSTGNGRMFVQNAADAFTVTWCTVRGFDKDQTVTVQASLLPDGNVEIVYGAAIDLAKAVVALSPGHDRPVQHDRSQRRGGRRRRRRGGRRTVFADDRSRSGRDGPEVLPIAPGQLRPAGDLDRCAVTDEAFAFETTVANEIRGIGVDIFDQSGAFGSTGGRLRSVVMMDTIGKYPADRSDTLPRRKRHA